MRKSKLSVQKAWALEHYKGMENLFMPSFSPDFKSLDEDGIRHDVRQSIRHGFFSTMLSGFGLRTPDEYKLLIKIGSIRCNFFYFLYKNWYIR